MLVIYALTALAAFFVWAAIHELSHLFAVKQYRKDVQSSIKLYPHRSDGRIVFAEALWNCTPDLTAKEFAVVSFAPRITDILGVLATVIVCHVTGAFGHVLTVLLGGSIVDLMVGSTGISEESDMRQYAAGWSVSPWVFRISGFAAAVAAIVYAALEMHLL